LQVVLLARNRVISSVRRLGGLSAASERTPMNEDNLFSHILRRLYAIWCQGSERVSLHDVRAETDVADTPFWNIVDEMTHKGLIRARTMGGYYEIDTTGVLEAERTGIAPHDLVESNNRLRERILWLLAEARETRGAFADVHYSQFVEATGVNQNNVISNIRVLQDLGLLEDSSMGSFRITHEGIEVSRRLRSLARIAAEFKSSVNLPPQARGRALQSLLARVIEAQGWQQVESARTSHEEIDVVFSHGREYFLLESKWEKDPIEAPVIREFYGKLSNRVDVKGVIASMSGFSKGAIEQALDYSSSRVILAFGPLDVDELIHGRNTLEDLLNEKYRAIVMSHQLIFR
jgi:predicted transcriptional regulator